MQPLITIVLLNYNGLTDTIECLNSIKKLKYSNFKVFVIDNNSTGEDVEVLSQKYSDFATIIENKSNIGFSGGNNIGIQLSLKLGAKYVLLLNNDTIIDANFLDVIVEVFNTNPKIGIVSSQINYYDEPYTIWSAGGKISKIRGSGFADSEQNETDVKQIDRYVSFVSGCAMMIKADVFEQIGFLDENFFLYVEDTDFCTRTTSAGFKIFVTSKTKVLHKVSRSTTKFTNYLPLYYTTRNRLYFAKKNFPKIFYLSYLYIFFVMYLKTLFSILKGNRSEIEIVNKAFLDFHRNKMGKAELEGTI